MREAWRRHWHGAALVALLLAFFADPLFTGRVFFYRDLGNLMQPALAAGMDAARAAGDVPLAFWSHALSNGRPLLANPGYALLAPLSLLYWLPFATAFNLFLVLHALIGALGMAHLARRLGASRAAAFAAGAAYGLGGGMISSIALYWAAVSAAWAPWTLSAAHAAGQRLTLRRVALLALALGVQALGGMPEVLLATIVAGVALTLAEAQGGPLARAGRAALAWAGAGAWGIAVAAACLVPAALHARTTLRSFGFTPQGMLYNSLDPRALPGLLLPRWGGSATERLAGGFPGAEWTDTGTPYLVSHHLGLVAASLAVLGVAWLWQQRRRWLALSLSLTALAGIAVALGRHVPGVEQLAFHAPFAMPLRYPVKALQATFLAVPLLAALGLDALAGLAAGRGGGRAARALPLLLALLVAGQLALAHRGMAPTIGREALGEPPLARALKARAAELGAGENQWRVHHERDPVRRWASRPGEVAPTEQAEYAWRRAILAPPLGAELGIHHAMEPTGDLLDDLGYFEMSRRAYASSRPDWARALGRAGVLFVVSERGDLEALTEGVLRHERELGPADGVPAGGIHVYRDEAWRPRASVAAGRVTGLAEQHFGVTMSVRSERAQELILSDALGDLPAWSATVDGAPVPLRRAEGAFAALDVPAGDHEVALRCAPRGFLTGLVISGLAVLAAAVSIARGGAGPVAGHRSGGDSGAA